MGENRLREYREGRGYTQNQAVAAIKRLARERGEIEPGLDPTALCRHERGRRRPSLYYQALYCEVYRATPVQLGFRPALPSESYPEDVDRREFLTSVAGFAASLALPVPTRLGETDIERLRQSVVQLYRLDDLYGAGAVYPLSVRTFHRLRSFVEHASYKATGRALQELTGHTAHHAGWLAYDRDRHDDARRWWTEAIQWSRRAESDSVSVRAMAAMSMQASNQRRHREAVDLAQAAQRSRSATPRLTSVLLAREARGHASAGDASRAHAALRRAREHTETTRDDDPTWLAFYGPADFASHERHIALALDDHTAAEHAARTALALNDPLFYPRNQALYLVGLAKVLVQRRELDEAAAVTRQASVAAAGLASARVARELQAVTQSLAA